MKRAAIMKAPMTNPADQPAEIWLRGNLRPVAALAVAAAVVCGALIAAVSLADSTAMHRGVVVAACGAAATAIGCMAIVTARPRLEHVGSDLRVRLSPTAVQRVPLAAVECFFPGSQPIARNGTPTCGDRAAFRVNTLVMRLAERAEEHQSRNTFTPWGTWSDGYVVFDGRWCEPLSPELARQLSRKLVDARRLMSDGSAAPAAASGVAP